jgi:CBS domain containing-hemolysin-like protein
VIWIIVGLAAVGMFLSAFFSGAETGFYRATRLRLVLDARAGDTVARALLFLTNHPALFVATALVGTTLANDLISLAVVIGFEMFWPGNPRATELIAPLVLSPFLLVYCDLLPKNMFLQAPNRLLRRAGPLFLLCTVVLLPIAAPLWALGWLLARWVRDSSEPIRLMIAQRELRHVLAEGHEAGILHPAQQTLAHGIFAVARRPVRHFLTPLAQVVRVRADMPRREVLRVAEQSHTAVLPVESPDAARRLVGCVRVIDLRMSESEAIGPLRPLLEIRDDATHLTALMRLESAGDSLARVVNARGETIGIVTLERLREPLF